MAAAVNSGPPSVAHSSGMPNVVNVRRKRLINPVELSCFFNYGPVRVSVYYDKVVYPLVVEEVGTYVLEWVCWLHWWGGWGTGL